MALTFKNRLTKFYKILEKKGKLKEDINIYELVEDAVEEDDDIYKMSKAYLSSDDDDVRESWIDSQNLFLWDAYSLKDGKKTIEKYDRWFKDPETRKKYRTWLQEDRVNNPDDWDIYRIYKWILKQYIHKKATQIANAANPPVLDDHGEEIIKSIGRGTFKIAYLTNMDKVITIEPAEQTKNFEHVGVTSREETNKFNKLLGIDMYRHELQTFWASCLEKNRENKESGELENALQFFNFPDGDEKTQFEEKEIKSYKEIMDTMKKHVLDDYKKYLVLPEKIGHNTSIGEDPDNPLVKENTYRVQKLPYCKSKDLNDYLNETESTKDEDDKNKDDKNKDDQMIKDCVEILKTIHALHQKNIVCMDIKPENTFVDCYDNKDNYLSLGDTDGFKFYKNKGKNCAITPGYFVKQGHFATDYFAWLQVFLLLYVKIYGKPKNFEECAKMVHDFGKVRGTYQKGNSWGDESKFKKGAVNYFENVMDKFGQLKTHKDTFNNITVSVETIVDGLRACLDVAFPSRVTRMTQIKNQYLKTLAYKQKKSDSNGWKEEHAFYSTEIKKVYLEAVEEATSSATIEEEGEGEGGRKSKKSSRGKKKKTRRKKKKTTRRRKKKTRRKKMKSQGKKKTRRKKLRRKKKKTRVKKM